MTFELNDNTQISKDERGNVQVLDHLQEPFVASVTPETLAFNGSASPNTPVGLADQYLKQVASAYGIDQNMLSSAAGNNGLSLESAPSDGKLELADEKEIMGTTTVSYQQTYDGLTVWKAGVSVTIQS